MLSYLTRVALLVVLATMPQLTRAQEPLGKVDRPLPLGSSSSSSEFRPPELTLVQQRAKFAADQRMLRTEWNNWIGYSPLRPHMNASYMSNGSPRYYIPSRGIIVSAGNAGTWYW